MKVVIFGLSVSSSWGNGHATLWRGLCRVLAQWGHQVVFFEKDVPYYAAHRDLHDLEGGKLCLYREWVDVESLAQRELDGADAAIVTSFCPDGDRASRLVFDAKRPLKVFYDLDTPVTLSTLSRGEGIPYLPASGMREFDLVLSYTGGAALRALQQQLGARRVYPLFGSVDPQVHRPAASLQRYRASVSYLGTYAEDRQPALTRLFVEAAQRMPDRRFLIGGALYPEDFPWTPNIHFVRHVPPPEHPSFFASSRLTLNVTRKAMAEMGHCPSGRLFEAAACGTPIVSDAWEGLEDFFTPDEEILIAHTTEEAIGAYLRSDEELARIAKAARARALEEHSAERRCAELVDHLSGSSSAVVQGKPAKVEAASMGR